MNPEATGLGVVLGAEKFSAEEFSMLVTLGWSCDRGSLDTSPNTVTTRLAINVATKFTAQCPDSA